MAGNINVDGFVDLHSHVGPSTFDRRVDGYEFASEAAAAGMDAVVMKEHYLPTVYGVPYIERLLQMNDEDISVFGSVVLNYCNGGFNPFVVQSVLDYGAKVIWAPTIDARNHGEKTAGVGKFLGVETVPPEYEGKAGLSALEENGRLRDDVALCIEKVADAEAVLAIGHLTYEETEVMTAYAAELGHDKILIDHPLFDVTDFDRDQMETLVSMGAMLNFPYCGLGPMFRWTSATEVYDHLRTIGIDHCVVSSDVGQLGNPSAPEALRIMGELLLAAGLSEADYRVLADRNPKDLLGLT